MAKEALIVGAGSGISAAVARGLAARGWTLALAARDTAKLASLAAETGASVHAVEATEAASVEALFAGLRARADALDLVLYNASYRVRGPLVELDPAEVARTLAVTAYGGFLVGQQAARRMLARGAGAIFFTGASASMKGYALSAPFAMGKAALRGLAQSMARELGPLGIHVAHFNIDGGVRNAARGRTEGPGAKPDSLLGPDAIAHTYLAVLDQPRSAWSLEVEVRPWVETF